jgi:hypothetical protein
VYSPFRWKGTGETNSTSYKCSSANYRTVFFAWPLEGSANLADRAYVMDAVIDWFGGCEGLGTDQSCVLLVDDDQSFASRVYLPLILR